MKFTQDPKNGITLIENGISARIFNFLPRVPMTANQHEVLATLNLKLQQEVGAIKTNSPRPITTAHTKKTEGEFFTKYTTKKTEGEFFTKYTTKETYDNHFSKGRFRIGSIIGFKQTPALHAQDTLEGYCNVVFKNGMHQSSLAVTAGDNLHLFCGSSNPESEYLKMKFGSIRMILRDFDRFGDTVANRLGAKKWHCDAVSYSNNKLYTSDITIEQIFNLNTLFESPKTLIQLYEFITTQCTTGTVYSKPAEYQPEEEFRFVFEMPNDLKEPDQVIVDPKLLSYFEVLDQ